MYSRTYQTRKNNQNPTSTPQTNPFVQRSFGEDTPQQSQPNKTPAELDAAYEEAKQRRLNSPEIPVYPPGKEPPIPNQSAFAQQIQAQIIQRNENEKLNQQRHSFPNFQSYSRLPIQAKMTIGEPGDKYEQEADNVASQVVNQINSPTSQTAPGQSVQRQEAEELQAKSDITTLQRQTDFPGKGHRLSDTSFSNDEERTEHRKKAMELLQQRYSSGKAQLPMEEIQTGSSESSTSPVTPVTKTTAFPGEGHRLSDWTFENNEEREAERQSTMRTAQARYTAGLPLFEGEQDITRIPSARSEQDSSSSKDMPSSLMDQSGSQNRFTSGATESEVNPIGRINNEPIPKDLKSALRERRMLLDEGHDEYEKVQEALNTYKTKVEEIIKKYLQEQPAKVGQLQRIWNWLTTENDQRLIAKYGHKNLDRLPDLIDSIEKEHKEIEKKKKEAEKNQLRQLINECKGLYINVQKLNEINYELLKNNKEYRKIYSDAISFYKLIRNNKQNLTVENLENLIKQLNMAAQKAKEIVNGAKVQDIVEKIGLDPYNQQDMNLIYQHYQSAGGRGERGQVETVCTKHEKYGGTYTYKGKSYDLYHDSHGNPHQSSSFSKTAWKILVNNKEQVVGVGYHIANDKYQAIFPFSTNKQPQKVGPSPNIIADA